jgi:hypothetical protein
MDNVLTLMNQVLLHFLTHIACCISIANLKCFIRFDPLVAVLVKLEIDDGR